MRYFMTLAALLCAASTVSAMQTGPTTKTVWQGVFTSEQAERGKETFEANCLSCHNRPADLSGGEAHALKGSVFFDRWREDTLQSLLNKMKGYMPPAKPRLADDKYVDIIAFLLGENQFPAGTQELKAAEVGNIRIEGKDGPQPLPNLAIVKVVGCLTPAAGSNWTLTKATDPVRTRESDQSSPEEIRASESVPLGVQIFQLRALDGLGNFDPEAHRGAKVQAKGVIYTSQTPIRLSLISVEALNTPCMP